jgi:hypothetical protein
MNSKILKIIQNMVVGFFALVFILGFFSKSLVNLFLPKVQAVPVAKKSTFSKSLDIEGIVEPKDVYKVRLDGDVIIDEYFVKIGDEVKKGQPIFKINSSFGIRSSSKTIEDIKLSIKKEKAALDKIKNDSYTTDEKNIQILQERINFKRKELLKLEKLYEAGSIPYAQLEREKLSLIEEELNLQIKRIELENKRKTDYLAIKEIESRIEKLNEELLNIEKSREFYSYIQDDDIYYSDINGVIININMASGVIYRDSIIVEIGIVNGFDSVKYTAYIPEKYYDFINNIKIIKLETNDRYMPKEVRIYNISKMVSNNMIRIEGNFSKDAKKQPVIGKKLLGIAEKKYTREDVIPKASVIPKEEFRIGSEGYVYIVIEEKGILGIEYIAKRVPIVMTGVGDNSVSVEGLKMYDNPKVITNLSYKIRDGVKVCLWE